MTRKYFKAIMKNCVVLSAEGGAIVEDGKAGVEFNPTYNTININNGEVTLREWFFTEEGFQYYNITPIVVRKLVLITL
jgi:hypothetical protein